MNEINRDFRDQNWQLYLIKNNLVYMLHMYQYINKIEVKKKFIFRQTFQNDIQWLAYVFIPNFSTFPQCDVLSTRIKINLNDFLYHLIITMRTFLWRCKIYFIVTQIIMGKKPSSRGFISNHLLLSPYFGEPHFHAITSWNSFRLWRFAHLESEIYAHSSSQNSIISFRLDGNRPWISIFKFIHIYKIGFRAGLSMDVSFVAMAWCLGLNLYRCLKSDRFSLRIALYLTSSTLLSTFTSLSILAEEKNFHSMMLPWLCFIIIHGVLRVIGSDKLSPNQVFWLKTRNFNFRFIRPENHLPYRLRKTENRTSHGFLSTITVFPFFSIKARF